MGIYCGKNLVSPISISFFREIFWGFGLTYSVTSLCTDSDKMYTWLQCTRFCSPSMTAMLYQPDITYSLITYPRLLWMQFSGWKASTAMPIMYSVLLAYHHMSTHAVMVGHTIMTATDVSIRVSACCRAGELLLDMRTGVRV